MARTTLWLKKNKKSNKKGKNQTGNRSKALKKKRTKRLRREKKLTGGVRAATSKNILLIIDPQNDFMDIEQTNNKRVPPFKGDPFNQTKDSEGLPVPNASTDMDRLALFLQNNTDFFDEIHVSLDSHTETHIGHIGFWSEATDIKPLQTFEAFINSAHLPLIGIRDAYGNFLQDKYATTKDENLQLWAIFYIFLMQKKIGKPKPCLWAKHCIRGSEGWKIYGPLASVLKEKNNVFYHEKGTNDLVEMYSIFSSEVKYEDVVQKVREYKLAWKKGAKEEGDATLEAIAGHPQIPQENVPENKTINKINTVPNTNTDFNQKLADQLYGEHNNNHIYICGEAKSHCVKTSIEDLLANVGEQGKKKKFGDDFKIYAITDMMSSIPGFEETTETAFNKMQQKGLSMILSEEIELMKR